MKEKLIHQVLSFTLLACLVSACSSGKKLTTQAGTVPPPYGSPDPQPPIDSSVASLELIDASGVSQSPSIDFDSPALQPLNQTQSQTVYLRNKGDATASQLSISSASPFSYSNSNCGNLAPGSKCSFTAAFSPTVAGALSSTLTVKYKSGSDSKELQITLSGNGKAALLPHLTLTPVSTNTARIDLGSVAIAPTPTPSTYQILVTNDGAADATSFLAQSVSSPSPFGVSSNCGSAIPTGGFCTLTVSFAPTPSFSAGDISGNIVLSYSGSDPANPVTIYLKGKILPQGPIPSGLPSCILDRVVNPSGVLLNDSVLLKVSLLTGSGPASSASVNGSAPAAIGTSPAYFTATRNSDGYYPTFSATVTGSGGTVTCQNGTALSVPYCRQVVTTTPDNVHTTVTLYGPISALNINGAAVPLPPSNMSSVITDFPQGFHDQALNQLLPARVTSSLGDQFACDYAYTVPVWPSIGIWRARIQTNGVDTDFLNGPVGTGIPSQLVSTYTMDYNAAPIVRLSKISAGSFTQPVYQCTTTSAALIRHRLTLSPTCGNIPGWAIDTFNGAVPNGFLGYVSTTSTSGATALKGFGSYFKAYPNAGTYVALRTDELPWANSLGYAGSESLKWAISP